MLLKFSPFLWDFLGKIKYNKFNKKSYKISKLELYNIKKDLKNK